MTKSTYDNELKNKIWLYKTYQNSILHYENKKQIKILKKLSNVCLINNLRDHWMKSHERKQLYNQGYDKIKNTLEI